MAPPPPFPEYPDSLAYITDADVKAAYRYLVEVSARIPGYRAAPYHHGFITRNLHYYRDSDGRSPFAFTVTKKWLLFYLREHSKSHPSLTLAELQRTFDIAAAPQHDHFTFKIFNVDQAQAAMRIAFGDDYLSAEISYPDDLPEGQAFVEGAARTVQVNSYERNPRARQACIDHYGCRCSVCDLSFEEAYGPIGRDFIHVHHLVEISSIGREYTVDPVKDLRPVCANCHAMLHRRVPALGIEELRELRDR